jgi:hypothetical protein
MIQKGAPPSHLHEKYFIDMKLLSSVILIVSDSVS